MDKNEVVMKKSGGEAIFLRFPSKNAEGAQTVWPGRQEIILKFDHTDVRLVQKMSCQIIDVYPIQKTAEGKVQGWSAHVHVWPSLEFRDYFNISIMPLVLRGVLIKQNAEGKLYVRLPCQKNFDRKTKKEVYFPILDIEEPDLKHALIEAIKAQAPEAIAAKQEQLAAEVKEGKIPATRNNFKKTSHKATQFASRRPPMR